MTRLSQSQLAMYAAAAGAANPQLAAAVGMAESGGNTSSHNIIPPDDSYGAWQINMLGALGPARRKQFGITSNSQLFDISTNARAMVALSNGGTDFSAWSTYTSGAYKRYLPGAQNAGWLGDLGNGIASGIDPLGNAAGIDPLGNLLNGGNPLSGVTDSLSFIDSAASWVSKASNWLRVGYVIGGGILVVVGLAMVAKDQELKVIAGSAGKVLGGQGKALGSKAKKSLKGAK